MQLCIHCQTLCAEPYHTVHYTPVSQVLQLERAVRMISFRYVCHDNRKSEDYVQCRRKRLAAGRHGAFTLDLEFERLTCKDQKGVCSTTALQAVQDQVARVIVRCKSASVYMGTFIHSLPLARHINITANGKKELTLQQQYSCTPPTVC